MSTVRVIIACLEHMLTDNYGMSAVETIGQTKEPTVNEQSQFTRLNAECSSRMMRRQFTAGTEGDGLPVARALGRTITSQLVHKVAGQIP